MNCDALLDRVRDTRRALDRETGEARAVLARAGALSAEVAELKRQIELHEKAAAMLTTIGEQRQAETQQKIEALVTRGLQAIFGDELSFRLVPVVRGKRPEVDLIVRSRLADGTTVDTDVIDARGGGLAAVVGFLLRLVILLLSAHRQDTVLFLDETFAHLSAEYEPRMAEFLRDLVDRTGVQVILVTHSDAYSDAADVRYRFTLHGGRTRVETV